MATLLLAAAGSALGGAVGGSVVGLTSLAVGKAVGASLGSIVDQRLLGSGAEPVETGKVERFRIMGSSEGEAMARAFGRMRVAGQIVWSSRFLESVNNRNVGGKGGGQKVREFSYSISLAVALCEGEVARVGRIWADGQPIDQSGVTWRLHSGSEDQLPDPVIAAIEGEDAAPAYRGTAYVVFEHLDLTPYGSRIPQFNFEVFRRPVADLLGVPRPPALDVRGVALVPGSGEYVLATEPVRLERGRGDSTVLNVHNDQGVPDIQASLGQLTTELPNADSVSLVVSWFGDDLRCDRCTLVPAVEQASADGVPMPWQVAGVGRAGAKLISVVDDRPVFGGTPADVSVMQAILALKDLGKSVMFYPFILMDIQAGNGLSDPWTGAANQPPVPWRGRITLARAAGQAGSSDKTAAAAAEVAAFFGTAQASDFASGVYAGPAEWSYRRFILHYANLCALAGGVDAFCIGSELRGLSQIRDGAASYPAVRELCALAAEVRSILGPGTRIGYAADWSEYFGHQPADGSGDVLYHLDPLWAHPAIDFVGIDNYMPLSDWRDGPDHADAAAGSIYDLGYLTANVAGGEGFDWFYADAAGRAAQDRRPIHDGAYGEDWVFRYKDLVNWWSRPHVNRPGGVKAGGNTEWVPKGKPIWFTEFGCPAVNKGTNQPNVFHDPKSSESFFPYFSSGSRDDFIQYRYLQAMFAHWSDPANNPESTVYGGRMVDMSRAHLWAWDARPWPDFPNRIDTWADGDNYARGHWLNGRASLTGLDQLVAEICNRAGMTDYAVGDLHGGVTGYVIDDVESPRQSLQPLMLACAFDSFTADGKVAFANRNGRVVAERSVDDCVDLGDEPVVSQVRAPAAETAGRVTVGFVRADMDYQAGAAEAVAPDEAEPSASQSSLPMVLSTAEAEAIAGRWLSEGRVARDSVTISLPPSDLAIVPGDILSVRTGDEASLFRVDRAEEMGHRVLNATRIEPGLYESPVYGESLVRPPVIVAPTPVYAQFLDLPLLTGDEVAWAPHVAVAKTPWTGAVAIYSANDDFGYVLNREVGAPAVIGETLEPFPAAALGRWMGGTLLVRAALGGLQSRSDAEVLAGANAAALRFGDGGDWEVIQFQNVELVGPGQYRLSRFLRGQAGTDGVMPDIWPAGTDFVVLDGAVGQIDLTASSRGLERHYRVGPAVRPYDDPSYVHQILAFAGVGLRPYRPTHFAAVRRTGGDIELRWTRRTRIDGDAWDGEDVPLGEDRERYHLRVVGAGGLLREYFATTSVQIYSVADQAVDATASPLTFEVAQLSDRFGPGPYERIEFDG